MIMGKLSFGIELVIEKTAVVLHYNYLSRISPADLRKVKKVWVSVLFILVLFSL